MYTAALTSVVVSASPNPQLAEMTRTPRRNTAPKAWPGDHRSSANTNTVSSVIRQAASTIADPQRRRLGAQEPRHHAVPRLGGVFFGHCAGTWRARSAVRPACPCRRPGRAESSGFAARPARRGAARPRDRPRLATSRHAGKGRHRTSSPPRAGGPARARWSSSPARRGGSGGAGSVPTADATARGRGTACHPNAFEDHRRDPSTCAARRWLHHVPRLVATSRSATRTGSLRWRGGIAPADHRKMKTTLC